MVNNLLILRFYILKLAKDRKGALWLLTIFVSCLLNSHSAQAKDWPIDKLLNGGELIYNTSMQLRYGLEIEVAPKYLRLKINDFDFNRLQEMKDNGDLFKVNHNGIIDLATYHFRYRDRIFTSGRSGDSELDKLYKSEINRWDEILLDYPNSEKVINALPVNIKNQLTAGLNLNSKLKLESPDQQLIIPDTNTIAKINQQQLPNGLNLKAFEDKFYRKNNIGLPAGKQDKIGDSIYMPDSDIYHLPEEFGNKNELSLKTSNHRGIEVPYTYLNSKDWLILKERWNNLPLSTKIQAVKFDHLSPIKRSKLYTLYPDLITIRDTSPGKYFFENINTPRETNHVVEYSYNYSYIEENSDKYLNDFYNIIDFFKLTSSVNSPLTKSQEGFSYHLNISTPIWKEKKKWEVDDFVLDLNILHLIQAHGIDTLHFNSLLDYNIIEYAHVLFVVNSQRKGEHSDGFGLVSRFKGPISMRPDNSRMEIRSHILPPKEELEFYKYYLSKPFETAKQEIEHEIINRIDIDTFDEIKEKSPSIAAAITNLLIDNLNYVLRFERSKKIKDTFDHAISWLDSYIVELVKQKQDQLEHSNNYIPVKKTDEKIDALQNELIKRISRLDEQSFVSLYYMIRKNSRFDKTQFENFWFRFLLTSINPYIRSPKNTKLSMAKRNILKLLINDNVNPFDMLRLIENNSFTGWNLVFSNLVAEFKELKVEFVSEKELETPTLQHLNAHQKSILSSLFITSLKETHRSIKNKTSHGILNADRFFNNYRSGSVLAKAIKFENIQLEQWSEFINANAPSAFKKDLYTHLLNKKTNGEELEISELNYMSDYLRKAKNNNHCFRFLTNK